MLFPLDFLDMFPAGEAVLLPTAEPRVGGILLRLRRRWSTRRGRERCFHVQVQSRRDNVITRWNRCGHVHDTPELLLFLLIQNFKVIIFIPWYCRLEVESAEEYFPGDWYFCGVLAAAEKSVREHLYIISRTFFADEVNLKVFSMIFIILSL